MTGDPPTVDGPKAPDPLVGTVLADRYRIEKQIGEGGMGTVYLARHILLEKVVALKVLHDEYARRRELVERFLHEARAASRIRHEHVIDITDFGETATKNVFFAMEYLEGHELATELDRSGTLPWPRVKKIMLQLCSALQAAHEAGVIHRDLKPENIFLIEKFGNPEFVKVLDFGVAKLTEFDDKTRRLTRTGMVFGTPEYMSPEQARGDKPDIRVDVYACGCILFEMVTGQVPFTGDSFMGVLTKQLFDPVPRLAERVARTDLPPGLQAVLDEALAKNREERFASMNELAVAIDTLDNLAGVVYAAPGASPGSKTPVARPAPSAVLAPLPVQSNATVRMSVAPVALTPAQRPPTTDQDRAATIPWTPPPPPAAPPPIAVAPIAVAVPAPPPPRPSPGLTPAPASFGDMGIQFDDDTASLRLPANKRRRLIIGGSIVAAVAAVAIIAVATRGGKTEVAVTTPTPTLPAAAAAAAPVPTPVAVVAAADAQPVAPVAVAPPPPVAIVKPPVVVAPPDAAPVAVRPAPPPVAVAAAPPHPAPPPAPAKVASAPPPSVSSDPPSAEHKKPKKRTASAGLPAPPPPETFPPTEPKAEKKPKTAPAAKPKSDLKDPFAD